MKDKNLIMMLGHQYLPNRDALSDLRYIVNDEIQKTNALPVKDLNSYFLMIAISSYNYGVMAGVRRERKRSRRAR